MNVLFFGDSLTAGYGLINPSLQSYPALIQKKIDDEKLNYKVINAGISGDTSGGGLNRINYWLNQKIDVFALELGINDVIRGVAPDVTLKNLQSIITKVRSKYPEVRMVMLGMELPSFIPGIYAAQFKTIFRKLADQNNMALVPFLLEGVAGKVHLNLRDGLHPSAEGYQIIAENVWPVLRKVL